jgi:uncharacterized protein YcaQ
VTKAVERLMHPRGFASRWPDGRTKRARLLLAFVREHGAVHPREVDRHFSHGRVTNYWGGSSSATTHLLEKMHYGGWLRVVRRESGVRIYAPHEHGEAPRDADARRTHIDALVDCVVRMYAPVPGATLSHLVRRLRYAAPQWHGELGDALQRARARLSLARVDGIDWHWPADAHPPRPRRRGAEQDTVRLLAPFDPVVWDRRRFELFWGWAYRFEAYTPLPKRKLGYYALPLLWRDRVIGWGNLSLKTGHLEADFGYVASKPPRDRVFHQELEAELERMRVFLGLDDGEG